MFKTINNCLNIKQYLTEKSLLALIFKQQCLLCSAVNTEANGVCADCMADLPRASAQNCPSCGLHSNGLVCGSCLRISPDFDATHAAFDYDFPINRLIQSYKYQGSLHINAFLAEVLAAKFNSEAFDFVIPMPMHAKRLQARGFNQAIEIAKVLTKNQSKKLDYNSVARLKLTPPQASLPLKARVNNIKGAFKVNRDFAGQRIAIIDDVMTTGASLNELAKSLKQAGAAYVACYVVARTHSNY